jgi:hypothetical protein
MEFKDVERVLDSAADAALQARRRIESAVDAGELPAWVLSACEQWEQAAMIYGAARAAPTRIGIPAPAVPALLH